MTKENAKDFLPLIQALAEGKTIQWNASGTDVPRWQDQMNPSFDEEPSQYRVKPQPREWWIMVNKDGHASIVSSKEQGERLKDRHWTELVHVQEVL